MAKEMGIELLRNIPRNVQLYDKWGIDEGLGNIADSAFPFDIIYFAESGQAFREPVRGQSFPWPPSNEDNERYRQQVRDAIKAIQQAQESK